MENKVGVGEGGEVKNISKEEAIGVYKKFIDRGITTPDDLDLKDPEVIEAHNLFDQWQAQEDTKIGNDEEISKRVNLAKTMFFVDAGFTDLKYLNEVLGWLQYDAEFTEQEPDNPESIQTRHEMAEATQKVRVLIRESQK